MPSAPTPSETTPLPLTDADWPWWRGRTRDGVATAGQSPPTNWSATKNILWKAPVPGRGHASATVVGQRVFLPTADETRQIQTVLCLERQTGRPLWSRVVHKGALEKRGHRRASQASATIACDGERLFVNFLHGGGMHTTALTLDGETLWQKKICDFETHQGFGSSPAIYDSLVIVSADNRNGGLISALDRKTGQSVWSHTRPKLPNYTSPTVLTAAGRDQVLLAGCNLVSSFDPLTGKKLWETPGATTECVTTMVTDGQRVFTSGGYPKNHLQALQADGSANVDWENNTRVYVPSMLVHQEHLYCVTDAGIAMCWNSATGKQLWKHRLGGTFNASAVLVNSQIYATNEKGHTFIFEANPGPFRLIAENIIGDEVFASPVICGDCVYLRTATLADDTRQEFLYCIAGSRR
ncbi:MAG: PQQ-binding-like beta-propeller repeat protein [Planctomycetaceae bacterium]